MQPIGTGKNMGEEKETLEVASATELHDWLVQNESRKTGIWLVTYKASSLRGRQISYAQIVDELLCFGWIDSLPRKLDQERSMLWISPRKVASAWSKLNKEKIAALEREGRLRPVAIAMIQEAKTLGTWDKLNDIEDGIIPQDLAVELEKYPGARANFDAFPKSVKKSILEWIVQAKTEATKRKRMSETAEQASQNQRANQWKGRKST
jgi:uncharacterized protein YdeI (YjbR/CyaY-like superfamily)